MFDGASFRTRTTAALASSLLALVPAYRLDAQPAPQVIRNGSCADCRIVLEELFVLGGDSDGEGLVDVFSKLAPDSRGRLYMAPTANPGEILVYDTAGALVSRLGRRGKGPGEYEGIHLIVVGPGDTLHVVDRNLARRTVLSPDHEVVRTHPLPGSNIYDVVVNEDGSLLVQTMLMSRDAIGLPIQLVDPAGKVTRSFGSTRPEYSRERPWERYRALTSAGDGRVWSAYHHQYQIELWGPAGTLVRALRRDVPWFTPWETYEPPIPTLRSIRQDEEGLLWVLIPVPDPNAPEEVGPGSHPPDAVWDTVIEVIDPAAGTLVASVRHPRLFERWADDLLYSWSDEPDGVPRLRVFRAEVARAPVGG